MLFKSKIDWMGEYNRYLESKGESCAIGCVIYNTETKETRQQIGNHTETDGLSYLVTSLREAGFDVDEFPTIKLSKRLNFLEKIILGAKFLYRELGPTRGIDWKFKKPQAPYAVLGPFTHYLTVEQTTELKTKARRSGVDVATILLYALNKAVDELMIDKKGINSWYIPFNMRGIYQGPLETSNHISNFMLPITEDDTLKTVLRKKFKYLRSGEVLSSFFFLNLGNYWLFKNMLKDKVNRDYTNPVVSQRAMGSFGYLGEWPQVDQNQLPPGTMVMPYSNVSLKNPICLTAMVWRNSLNFAITFHSSILESEAHGNKVLQRMIEIMKAV